MAMKKSAKKAQPAKAKPKAEAKATAKPKATAKATAKPKAKATAKPKATANATATPTATANAPATAKATAKPKAKATPKPKATARPKAPKAKPPSGEMLTMEAEISAPPETIYAAWLDAAQHSAMTGAKATGTAKVGGKFTAWDGYIQGRYLHLEPSERIVATWRTAEFAPSDPDSQLDVLLGAHRVDGKPGTRLFLIHTNLPRGGASKYAAGWAEFYFAPMSAHFSA